MNIDLQWKHEYELGVEDIDLQHHYFLNLINKIAVETSKLNDKQYLDSLINELVAYARFHFISEETMMLHSRYPGYEEHHRLHLELIDGLGIEMHNMLSHETQIERDESIIFLKNWFLNHTNGVDRQFTDYLHNRIK